MDMAKIGAFLQELRKEHHLTQEQLGEKLHVSSKTISRWEIGTYMPPAEMLLALSELYGVSINELLSGRRNSPNTNPASQNITPVPATNPFPLQERRGFWRSKWETDHRWTWIVLISVHGILQIVAMSLDTAWLHAVIALAAIAAAVLLRNRREAYVEHHLYGDLQDN